MKLDYIVTKSENNQTLKTILKNKLYISSALLSRIKQNNDIYVNDTKVFVNYIVKENDKITVNLSNSVNKIDFSKKFILKDMPLDILYEDEYLLIINKPCNMPIHPSANNYENTLSNIVASYLKKQNIPSIHIVTRLDHDTTGICIFAKNEYIQELFIRKKEEINLQKWYIAIVNGIVENKYDIIETNIARKRNTIILREVNKNGDFAKTEYFVKKINKEKNYTVLSILLHTGRTHQIRVHMSYINHTLLGDELYAKEYIIKNISKYINRQALHCNKIVFNHPITNRKLEIVSDLPNDMKKLVQEENN